MRSYHKQYMKTYKRVPNHITENNYRKQKRKTDIIFSTKERIRGRINKILSGRKSNATQNILGCSNTELKKYLINRFEKDYTIKWDDKFLSLVQLDHIVPLSIATNEESIYQLNYYTNLRYLYWKDNNLKSNNLNWKLDLSKTDFFKELGEEDE